MSQEVFTPKASGHMVFGPWNRAIHLFHVPELWVTRNVGWKSILQRLFSRNIRLFLQAWASPWGDA